MTRTSVGMRRLGRMRILVVGVIIRRGTLETDTFIMLGRRCLPLCVIGRTRGGRVRGRLVRIRLWGIMSRGWRWRITVLRLTMWTWRAKRLSMSAIEHWLFSFTGVRLLSILTGAIIRLTSNRSSRTRTIDSRSRNKGSLRGDWVKQALLIEADAILATAIRRTIVA
jgi:hypothetical protein